MATKNTRQLIVRDFSAATLSVTAIGTCGAYRFVPTSSITSTVVTVDASTSNSRAQVTIIVANDADNNPGKVTIRGKSGKKIYCQGFGESSAPANDKGVVNNGENPGDWVTVISDGAGDAAVMEMSGQWSREA